MCKDQIRKYSKRFKFNYSSSDHCKKSIKGNEIVTVHNDQILIPVLNLLKVPINIIKPDIEKLSYENFLEVKERPLDVE